ncbi:MAG: type IV pilus modification protein PilV [Azoarcus sp.]|jgi:type IV pilus assembly protein PilV|nr:type IV pilus modification protein PilV [Azoarcus sp.]
MRTFASIRARFFQAGSSLIEVLVSVFILAFGILGAASMQANALRGNEGSLEQSAAVLLVQSIFESMRASMMPATTEDGDRSVMAVRPGYDTGGSYLCDGHSVASAGIAGEDLRHWVESIHASLGDDACGKVSCGAADANLCEVSVKWNNSRSPGGQAEQAVTSRSRL